MSAIDIIGITNQDKYQFIYEQLEGFYNNPTKTSSKIARLCGMDSRSLFYKINYNSQEENRFTSTLTELAYLFANNIGQTPEETRKRIFETPDKFGKTPSNYFYYRISSIPINGWNWLSDLRKESRLESFKSIEKGTAYRTVDHRGNTAEGIATTLTMAEGQPIWLSERDTVLCRENSLKSLTAVPLDNYAYSINENIFLSPEGESYYGRIHRQAALQANDY